MVVRHGPMSSIGLHIRVHVGMSAFMVNDMLDLEQKICMYTRSMDGRKCWKRLISAQIMILHGYETTI